MTTLNPPPNLEPTTLAKIINDLRQTAPSPIPSTYLAHLTLADQEWVIEGSKSLSFAATLYHANFPERTIHAALRITSPIDALINVLEYLYSLYNDAPCTPLTLS